MDPKERREDAGEDRHLESEEGSSGEGKSSELRKEESSNSFVSAEEDPEENPSEESRKNPREIRRTSKKDTVGDEIQELESPEEKIQGTDAEIPEEFQEGNPRIEDECKETEDLQTSLPPEQVDTGKLDELFTYSTRDIEESSDSEPRLRRKNTRRRVDFDVSVENVESGKDVGDTSKQMEKLPSVQLGQEKSKDAEIEVVADSATETKVLKSKEDDEPEVDSRAQKVESKKPKVQRKTKSQPALVITEHKTPKKSEKRKAEPAKDMLRAKSSKISKEYQKEKMKGKRKVQEETEIPSSPSGSEDEELLASLCMSHQFVDEKSEQRFNDMKNLNTIVERNVNVSNLKEQGIWDILERLSLEETATYACPHSKILIKEFYANITKKIVKAGDPMYHRVYIRGKILHFSPAVINKFLGLKNSVVPIMDELDREIDQKELEIALTDTFDEKRKGEIAPSGVELRGFSTFQNSQS
ncbi:PREDICTED: TRAF3-interacting protein 1-like [Tarenaya hassleriana]|uniref:TRAF3-interacting protein 1-like n=1 Tax=Tarenaya hassleriana TaxID=28532 RepID=UPI00053C5FB4|nr:PREDICTED: TRAF3-interacting protein 1-like [Tarenaya hassleriana]